MPTAKNILIVKGSNVIVLAPTTTVQKAVDVMAEINVGCIVVGDETEVLGIFTERDLLRRVVALGTDPLSIVLYDVMSSPIKTCNVTDDTRKCVETLIKTHIRHIAVVGEEGTLIGLISLRDILTAELHDRREKLKVLKSPSEQKSMQSAG